MIPLVVSMVFYLIYFSLTFKVFFLRVSLQGIPGNK